MARSRKLELTMSSSTGRAIISNFIKRSIKSSYDSFCRLIAKSGRSRPLKRNYICFLMLAKNTLLLLLVCASFTHALAQRTRVHKNGKSVYTQKRFNVNATRVRGEKAKIVCPIFVNSKYPFHGFGFKLGDPFGLTYKFYANKKIAFVADVGK